jgi:hypothetical protein
MVSMLLRSLLSVIIYPLSALDIGFPLPCLAYAGASSIPGNLGNPPTRRTLRGTSAGNTPLGKGQGCSDKTAGDQLINM